MLQRALLVIGIGLLVLVAVGVLVELRRAAAPPEAEPRIDVPGRWRALRPARGDPSLNAEQRAEVERLEALGYASGSVESTERSGVTLHDRERAFAGLNFFTSGHGPEAALMDMEGRVLHRWRYEFLDVWPDFPPEWLQGENFDFWRRAHLLPNGDVIAIFEGAGIIKVDKDSRLVWANPIAAHHDLEVLANGAIYVLTRRVHVLPRIDPETPVMEDFITVLGPDGAERRSFSLLRAFERSEFNHYWDPPDRGGGRDLFHTNTLELLEGRAGRRVPAFSRGNLLISALTPSVVAVVDPRREQIVWAAKGSFVQQHDPKILDNGGMLLFDNRGGGGRSRVLELDPAAPEEPIWSYSDSEETPFFSATCGTAERLPNGNTLIVESDAGRAFEVTREKEIVWEFHNPHRAGPHDGFVATLFDVVRLPRDFPTDWVRSPPSAGDSGVIPGHASAPAPRIGTAVRRADAAPGG